jgi:hypothetical protein
MAAASAGTTLAHRGSEVAGQCELAVDEQVGRVTEQAAR